MAVGAKDKTDKAIVKRYYNLKMENLDSTKLVDPQKMIATMNDYAMMQRNFMDMNQKLKSVCSNVSAMAAVYRPIIFNPPKARR